MPQEARSKKEQDKDLHPRNTSRNAYRIVDMLSAYSASNNEHNRHWNPRISLVDGDNAIAAECKLSSKSLSGRTCQEA